MLTYIYPKYGPYPVKRLRGVDANKRRMYQTVEVLKVERGNAIVRLAGKGTNPFVVSETRLEEVE